MNEIGLAAPKSRVKICCTQQLRGLDTAYAVSRLSCFMCGIFFSVKRDETYLPDEKTAEFLKSRGPDSYHRLIVPLPKHSDGVSNQNSSRRYLTFFSTVLALRGKLIQEQPLCDHQTGSVLCWNGEGWKFDGQQIQGNDAVTIFDHLISAAKHENCSHTDILEVLTRISGPFAFVFYNSISNTIYFGRDRLGRRSLLSSQRDNCEFILSSVTDAARDSDMIEVDSSRIHCIDLNNDQLIISHIDWTTPKSQINRLLPENTIQSTPLQSSVKNLSQSLRNSLFLRVVDIPTHNLYTTQKNEARVAVLFSGGLDCTLLARLAHEIIHHNETIDLLNVAFENPRSIAANARGTQDHYESCPDRITGRSSFEELVHVCPNRTWRFVAINISYSELLIHKPDIIRLMYPHNTEMDLSIAMALYFAARGSGYSSESPTVNQSQAIYTSTARVLLSGLGADELFGGYSRHAAAFARGSYASLIEELELDITRIGGRNLGRDDRIMSHWGKEVRYPYLDEEFVEFSLNLPVWEKCGFRETRHIPKHYEKATAAEKVEDLDPAKMILRMLIWNLGMRNVANERKRAIQFGARTAKMEIGGGRKKGTDTLTLN